MRIWNPLARTRWAHWRLALFPVGTLINGLGNGLYFTPYRYIGVLIFLAGGAVALYSLWVVDELPVWGLLAVRLGTPRWRRLRGNVRLLLGAAVVLAFPYSARFSIGRILHRAALPSDFEPAAGALLWTWLLISRYVSSVEPEDAPFERLPGRIARAAPLRILANGIGLAGAGVFAYPRLLSGYPAQTVSLGATLAVTLVVITHKVNARVRKLCTQVHVASQTLRRDLDELAAADPAELATGLQNAARRSWDALAPCLRTGLDTGYALFGVPFLRAEVVADLQNRVLAAIDAMPGEPDAGKQVVEDLEAIIRASSEKIDTAA